MQIPLNLSILYNAVRAKASLDLSKLQEENKMTDFILEDPIINDDHIDLYSRYSNVCLKRIKEELNLAEDNYNDMFDKLTKSLSLLATYIGTKMKYGGNQPRHPHHNRRLLKLKKLKCLDKIKKVNEFFYLPLVRRKNLGAILVAPVQGKFSGLVCLHNT